MLEFEKEKTIVPIQLGTEVSPYGLSYVLNIILKTYEWREIKQIYFSKVINSMLSISNLRGKKISSDICKKVRPQFRKPKIPVYIFS